MTGTEMVRWVWPGVKVTVPEAAGRSEPTRAVPDSTVYFTLAVPVVTPERASVIVALIASAALTFLAMEKATGMALAIAASFDLGVFLPLARHPFCRYSYGFKPGWPLKRYGIEQQAEIVRHAFLLRRGVRVPGAPELARYEGVLPFAG